VVFADSNRASIRYIVESVTAWGKTPANGKSRQLRFTSSTLSANKETAISDELRADRMVSSVPEVGATSEGEVNFELSAGSHDDFLQAFLLGFWSRPMTFDYFKGNTVSWTANNTITISGQDASDYFVIGRRIKTEGFATAANNGYFEVTATAFAGGNTTVTVSTSTSVAEGGSSSTKVLDANDVIVLNSTTLRLGTGGASTIDSNGGNAFAAAIAAGQLKSGQKIFVDSAASPATFSNVLVTFSDDAVVGDSISISDGLQVEILVAGTDFEPGADDEASAANLAAAVNKLRNQSGFKVKAVAAAEVVTIFSLDNGENFGVTPVGVPASFTVGAVTPATAPGARGFFTITGVADDVLTVSPQPPTLATPGVTSIKGSMLRNPGDVAEITPQSFSLQQSFNDVDKHFLQNGMRVGTYSLDVSTGAIVTGSLSFQGKETAVLNNDKLGLAPYDVLESTATEVMNATTNVGALTKNGQPLSSAVQSITLEGEASLRNQNAVGSKFPRGIGTGRFNLTGTLTAYFETLELYTDFLNHTTISIGFDFQDQDSNVYFYTVPALKITSDPVNPTGIDEDVVEEMEWSALRDPNTKCMLQVDRFSSILPR
jgi:hypothetical protein